MKYRFVFHAAAAAALLLSPVLNFADDKKPVGAQQPASQAKASQNSTIPGKSENAAQHKAAVPTKLVDINSASRDELKKLPGIRDTEARKIIAGRPYLSKAQLVTRNVLDRDVYENLKKLIIAKQS